MFVVIFFFQAEDGIRDLVRSRGLGDVYKRQKQVGRDESQSRRPRDGESTWLEVNQQRLNQRRRPVLQWTCLLYTSDAADERSSVDLGGRRIIKKKKKEAVQVSQIRILKKHYIQQIKTAYWKKTKE